jgi:hypothetical protein
MTQQDENAPKRRRTKKPSQKQQEKKIAEEVEKESSKKESPQSKKVKDEYKKKIQEALQTNLDEYIKSRNLSQQQISSINSFVEEHLSCFVLLGYTVDGSPISLVNATTQKDSDSLGALLQKFLHKNTDTPNIPPTV